MSALATGVIAVAAMSATTVVASALVPALNSFLIESRPRADRRVPGSRTAGPSG
ncbi:hypothetical protein [Streptomyces sp. NPDC003952]